MRGALLTLLAVAGTARADAPCKSCVLEAPATKEAVPLVVILHGDREHASAAAARWHAAVAKRGWALLAIECPADRGCKQSWWQWDGEPRYVLDLIDAVGKQHAIDPARVYLIGWSGGASYIGSRAQAWSDRIAAAVFHGGGMPPRDDECPERALPAYFLVGDRNPLHRLAIELRGFFERCGRDVTWDLVRGGDHGKEEAALTVKKAAAILDWLAAKQR